MGHHLQQRDIEAPANYTRWVGLEKGTGRQFTRSEHVNLYTVVYNMCNQKEPFCYTAQLYTLFQQSIDHYLRTESLPKIRKRPSGLYLVKFGDRFDLGKGLDIGGLQGENPRVSLRPRCFPSLRYLNRYYVRRDSKLSLKQVCTASFKTHIFVPLHTRLTSTILALLLKDRENTATAGESKGDKKDDYKAPSEERLGTQNSGLPYAAVIGCHTE
eukprot:1390255-Amorphochlora_amoeboformis.AAC.1